MGESQRRAHPDSVAHRAGGDCDASDQDEFSNVAERSDATNSKLRRWSKDCADGGASTHKEKSHRSQGPPLQEGTTEGKLLYTRAQLKDREEELAMQQAKQYKLEKEVCYDDTDGNTMMSLLRPLLTDAMEAGRLRAQVHSLQKEMLASVEKVQAISDEQFAQDFRALASGVKALSQITHLTAGVNIFEILGSPVLLENVLSHHWIDRGRKKLFVEAYL